MLTQNKIVKKIEYMEGGSRGMEWKEEGKWWEKIIKRKERLSVGLRGRGEMEGNTK